MTAPAIRLAVIDETDAVAADVAIRQVLEDNATRLDRLIERVIARRVAGEFAVIELIHTSCPNYAQCALQLSLNVLADPSVRDFLTDLADARGYAGLLEGARMVRDLRAQAAQFAALGLDAAKCARIHQLANATEAALSLDGVLVVAYVGTAIGFYRWSCPLPAPSLPVLEPLT